jgi:hypothetical protein
LMFRMPLFMVSLRKRYTCVSPWSRWSSSSATFVSPCQGALWSEAGSPCLACTSWHRTSGSWFCSLYGWHLTVPYVSAGLVSVLSGDFVVKDLGKLHYFLGLTLTQQKYSPDLLRCSSMLKCKTTTTPMTSTDRLSALDLYSSFCWWCHRVPHCCWWSTVLDYHLSWCFLCYQPCMSVSPCTLRFSLD